MRALRALVAGMTDKYLLNAAVRYRVVGAPVGTKYNLQAVKKGAWPDTTLARVMPGAAGYKASLKDGTIVVVQFLEGDESEPRITGFAGPDDDRFLADLVEVNGADAGIAYQGSLVNVQMPPAMPVSGLLDGVQFTGVITLPGVMIGTIQTASSKAKVGF